jgi:hypothetical protein
LQEIEKAFKAYSIWSHETVFFLQKLTQARIV